MLVVVGIPRCGSTSLKKLLQWQYRGNWSGLIGHTAEEAYSIYLKEKVRRANTSTNRSILCVSGHIPYGFHKYHHEPVDYVYMARNPIDRVVSLWKFTYDLHKKSLVNWINESDDYTHNQAVRYMSGGPIAFPWKTLPYSDLIPKTILPLTDSDLEIAKDNISTCFFVGLLKSFNKLQKKLEFNFGWESREEPHIHQTENYNLTTKEIAVIESKNILDIELYNWTKGIII